MGFFHLVIGILLAIAAASVASTAGDNAKCSCYGYELLANELSDKLQPDEVLKVHQEIRESVANGDEVVSGGNKLLPAFGMKKLQWSEELAASAQEQLDTCNGAAEAQLAATGPPLDGLPSSDSYKEMIELWRGQAQHFNQSMVASLPDDPNVKAFAQLIWANTSYVGCGSAVVRIGTATGSSLYRQHFACHYSPGVAVGLQVYNANVCHPDDTCCEIHAGLTETQRSSILGSINRARRSVAGGLVYGKDGNLLPEASNMNKLTWSDDLAQLAQEQLDNCELEEAMPAASDDWIQLMATTQPELPQSESGGAELWTPSIKGLVGSWLSGAQHFDKFMVESFPEDWRVREYGQLIWAKTREVGCAFVVHKLNYLPGKHQASLACNFRTGLKAGMEVYSKGTPGSGCPCSDNEEEHLLCPPE